MPILLSSVAAFKWVAAAFKSRHSMATVGQVSDKGDDSSKVTVCSSGSETQGDSLTISKDKID